MSVFGDHIEKLAATIASRKGADPAKSWSARLLSDPELAAKKLSEEAIELSLAAVAGRRESVIAESADLIYHWLALIAGAGVGLEDVAEALAAREVQSGIAEKASREINSGAAATGAPAEPAGPEEPGRRKGATASPTGSGRPR